VPETNLAHLGPAIRWRRHASTLARPEPTARQLRLADGHASAPTRPEPTCFTDIVWQAAKNALGTCIPESRACLSRQSSLERKASATDKCPTSLRTASLRTASLRTASLRTASLRTASLRTASLRTASLRTASHFLCPGNGTLFYGEKRYVRYGAAFLFGKVPIRTPNEGS